MYYDPVKSAIDVVCAAFGIPLNFFVGGVLICNPSLYSARNAIWIGVIICNILTLVLGLIEVWAVAGGGDEVCLIYTALMGKPYNMVLANLLLATCDRYVYTKWPHWHEKHVTVARVLTVEITLTALIPFSLTTPFWLMDMPLRCGYDLRGNNCTFVLMLILNVLCIVSKSVVYYQSKKQAAGGQQSNGVTSREIPMISFLFSRKTDEARWDPPADSPGIMAHSDSQYIRQREMEATTSLVAGLVPLCVFTLPNLFWVLWYWLNNSANSWGPFESITAHTALYFRDMVLFHVCTNLLVYIFCSKEFKSTVRENYTNWRRRSVRSIPF